MMNAGALERIHRAIDEIEKVVVGQRALIQKVFIALLSDGHVSLEGAPGLAKTLLVVGTYLYVGGHFEIEKGPIIGPWRPRIPCET